MTNDLFELVKAQDINMKEFLETHYGFEFKRNKALCPFHDDTKASFSYAPKINTCKCMSCEAGGDLINFIVAYKNVSKLQACMEILDRLNICYTRPGEKETTVETKEEREKREKEFEEQKKKNEAKKLAKQKELESLKAKAINSMTKKAPIFQKNLDFFEHHKEISSMIYNKSDTFLKWIDLYLGYDNKHDSICILNRILDKDKTTFNIKHRQKYQWDGQKHTDKRVNGKWISHIDATTYAFPYDYFIQKSKDDDIVFLTEGEKDALNLLSYDINVLTLGGVSTSWKNHKQLLKDKIVYIWFDHDNAGYEGAVKRYCEIKDIAKEVYITLFFHINNKLANKYDLSNFIFDNKFKNKEEIFNSIAYSSYKLTTYRFPL